MQNSLPNLNNPNNYIIDPMGEAYESVYNAPMYNPIIQSQMMPTQQATPVQQYQPTQELLDYINNIGTAEPTESKNLREGWGNAPVNIQGHPILSDIATIGKNAVMDVPQIATGFVSMAGDFIQHPIESTINQGRAAGEYINNLRDRVKTESLTGNESLDRLYNPLNIPLLKAGQLAQKDLYNFWYGSALPILHTETLGSAIEDIQKGNGDAAFKKLKEAGVESYEQFKKDPLITSLILAPNTTTRAIKGVGTAGLNLAERAGLPIGEKAMNVAKAVETVESKFNKEKVELLKASDELSKAKAGDLEAVIRNYTEGTPLPENLTKLRDKFAKFQDEYRKTFDDNALVNPNELSALQYVQRQTGKTMQEVRRELAPQLEMLQEGVTNPSLSFRNRLSDFEHAVNSLRKDNKEFLQDSKLVKDLSKKESEAFASHFDNAEIDMMKATNMSVKEAKQYLGDLSRDAWVESKVSDAALKDIRFQENMAKLAERAEATGDPMLKHLYDGMSKANRGEIGTYTLAGAKVPESGLVSNEGRRFQGKSSSREYGTAEYKDIATAYRNIHNFLDDVANQKLKQEISNNILNTGTIDGATKLVGENIAEKDIKYLNADLLADGKLSEAITLASDKLKPNAVAIDKYNLNALKSFTLPENTPFRKGALNDMYNLAKETMLASGTYLGGNFISGLYGTLLNAATPQGLIKDAIASIGSKGALSRELGTIRTIRPANRRYSTKLAQGTSTLGRWLGTGIAPRIDAVMQNMFSEINANAQLRKMGIAPQNRLSALAEMDKMKLGQLINNNRLASMMNTKYRIFPRGDVRSVLSIANPFLDWIDTSTQVSAKMLIDHPILMGAVTSKLFGEIGFDKELQKRLGLKVYTDKPLVTYKADKDAPSGSKEVTLSFLPQLTPVEFLVNPMKLLTGNSGAPVLSAIYEASKGKNAYGNALRRSHAKDSMMAVQNGQRYIVNPETRNIEPVKGTMGDEVLSTAIKNLFAPTSIVNKTVMPTVADLYSRITGNEAHWYMPYGQSIFGSFTTGQPERGQLSRNILYTGDPRKERTVQDIIKGLGTYYERDYIPEGISGNLMRQIRRAGARQNWRDYGE